MRVYSKEIISYAFYKHVELVDFEDYVYRGWLVPDINNPKNYLILSEHRDNIPVFKRSHIKSITYTSNGYTLPKRGIN